MIPLRDNIHSRSRPLVNYALISINVAVFIYQLKLNSLGILGPFINNYSVTPSLLLSDPNLHFMTLITSQFLHGGFLHLIGNMLFLYIFGDNVEDKFGHFPYMVFFVLSGVGAALLQVYFNPVSVIPMIGASGSIAGVLGAYFILYPRAKVMTLIPLWIFSRVVDIPAFLFLGIWFIVQMYNGTANFYVTSMSGVDSGGVAWWAHSGGFIVGFIAAVLYKIKTYVYR